MDKPNILFIFTDQQRIDTLRCYGGRDCYTPNLDRLSEEGFVFENAYTVCPICTPARASLQTGLYPFKHGMTNNVYTIGNRYEELPDSDRLLGRKLESQGYSVGYTGKWHLGFGKMTDEIPWEFEQHYKKYYYIDGLDYGCALPSNRGYEADDYPGHGQGGHNSSHFKRYLKEKGLEHKIDNPFKLYGYEGGEVVSPIESTSSYFAAQRAIDYIGEFSKRDRPFFFMLNFFGPHEPYFAHKEYLDMYKDKKIAPWPSFNEDVQNKPFIHEYKRNEPVEWERVEDAIKHYYALMTEIDSQIGRIIQYLKDNGLYDDTVIVFSADHGETLGVHNGLSDKALNMYEEICRIPLIIKSMGEASTKRISEFANTCDIYSTILELAGVDRFEAQRDGLSLVPLLKGEGSALRDCVVTECTGIEHILFTQRMIRKGNLKYVFNSGGLDELYDLDRDPCEMANQINNSKYTLKLEDMRQSLAHWLENMGDGLVNQFRAVHRLE